MLDLLWVIDRLCAAHNAFVRHATNERAFSQDTVMDFCYLLARMRRWNMSKAQFYREMLLRFASKPGLQLIYGIIGESDD